MPTKRVSYPVELKAIGDSNGVGRVEALVSIFGNVDVVGDRVVKGAFVKSIAEWKASGDPVPVVFSHEWDDVWSHIGVVEILEETLKGLRSVYALDIADNPVAAQVYKLLKRRSLKDHSFAYEIVTERTAKDGANELVELKIIELGPTLKGANPDTELIAVKTAIDQAAVEAQTKGETMLHSLSGRKVYLDADLPGTFEETRDAICEAARALLNPSGDADTYVYVEATYPDSALVEVHRPGADDEHFQVSWSRADDDSIVLGEPTAVDVNVTVTPKSAGALSKAGRRISKTTEAELNAIHDELGSSVASLQARMKSLIGTATEDDGKAAGAGATGTLVEQPYPTGEEPEATPAREDFLATKSLIDDARILQGALSAHDS